MPITIPNRKPIGKPPVTWGRNRTEPLDTEEMVKLLQWLGVRGDPVTDWDFELVERAVRRAGLPPLPGDDSEGTHRPPPVKRRASRALPDKPDLGMSDAEKLAEQLRGDGWQLLQESDLTAADARGPNPIAEIRSFWTRTDESQGYPRVRPEPWIRKRFGAGSQLPPDTGGAIFETGDESRVVLDDRDGQLTEEVETSIASSDVPDLILETLTQLGVSDEFSPAELTDALDRAIAQLDHDEVPDVARGYLPGQPPARWVTGPDPAFASWGKPATRTAARASSARTTAVPRSTAYSNPALLGFAPRAPTAASYGTKGVTVKRLQELQRGVQRLSDVYKRVTQAPRTPSTYPGGGGGGEGGTSDFPGNDYPPAEAPEELLTGIDGTPISEAEALAALDQLAPEELASALAEAGGPLAEAGELLASGELGSIADLAAAAGDFAAPALEGVGASLAEIGGSALAEGAAEGLATGLAESLAAEGASIGLGSIASFIPYVGWVIAAFMAARSAGLFGGGKTPARGTGYHIVGEYGPDGFSGTVYGMSRNAKDSFEFPLTPQWRWREAFTEAARAAYAAKGTSDPVPINFYTGMDETKFVPGVVRAVTLGTPIARVQSAPALVSDQGDAATATTLAAVPLAFTTYTDNTSTGADLGSSGD